MVICYTKEENIFAVVQKFLFQKKYQNIKSKIALSLINMLKKGEYTKFKNLEIKIKSPFVIYASFEII